MKRSDSMISQKEFRPASDEKNGEVSKIMADTHSTVASVRTRGTNTENQHANKGLFRILVSVVNTAFVLTFFGSVLTGCRSQPQSSSQPPATVSSGISQQPKDRSVISSNKGQTLPVTPNDTWDTRISNGTVAIKFNAAPYPGTDGPSLFLDIWKDTSSDLTLNSVRISSETQSGKPYSRTYNIKKSISLQKETPLTILFAEPNHAANDWGVGSKFRISLTMRQNIAVQSFLVTVPDILRIPSDFTDRETNAKMLPER